LTIKIIQDVQGSEATAIAEGIAHKIQRPGAMRRRGLRERQLDPIGNSLFAFSTQIQFEHRVNSI